MNVRDIDAAAIRDAADQPDADGSSFEAVLHPQFRARWSPRAFAATPLSNADLLTLIEAARWAPSCFNAQPWRFAWVLRESAAWPGLLDTLLETNRNWASNAGALLAIASRTTFEQNGQSAPTHAFDTGAAWMSIALQARHQGLVAHAMRGFDVERASATLALPAGHELWALVAIGHPGERDALPEPYRSREQPTPRRPLEEIAFVDGFHGLAD